VLPLYSHSLRGWSIDSSSVCALQSIDLHQAMKLFLMVERKSGHHQHSLRGWSIDSSSVCALQSIDLHQAMKLFHCTCLG